MNKRVILAAVLLLFVIAADVCLQIVLDIVSVKDIIWDAIKCGLAFYFIWKYQKALDIYQDILRDAFRNDKRSRKALRKAFQLYSIGGQHIRVMKRADRLESACADNADYAAVSMLRALCYGEMGKPDEATRFCGAVEQYGFTIPDAAKDAIFHPKTLTFKRKTGC